MGLFMLQKAFSDIDMEVWWTHTTIRVNSTVIDVNWTWGVVLAVDTPTDLVLHKADLDFMVSWGKFQTRLILPVVTKQSAIFFKWKLWIKLQCFRSHLTSSAQGLIRYMQQIKKSTIVFKEGNNGFTAFSLTIALICFSLIKWSTIITLCFLYAGWWQWLRGI